eukprot:gene3413-3686_t
MRALRGLRALMRDITALRGLRAFREMRSQKRNEGNEGFEGSEGIEGNEGNEVQRALREMRGMKERRGMKALMEMRGVRALRALREMRALRGMRALRALREMRTMKGLRDLLVLKMASSVSSQELLKKERRFYTTYFFKQDKYNLLREENEGYSKLLTLLLSGGTLKQQQLPALAREIKAMIGAFKLDPNRVCDLVLEAAERDPQSVEVWLQLMDLFNKEAPVLMLAMKFTHYAQEHKAVGDEEGAVPTAAEPGRPRQPPASLFQLAAGMIKGHDAEMRASDNLAAKTKELAELKRKQQHYQEVIGPLRIEREAMVARHKEVVQRLEGEKDSYITLKSIKQHNNLFIRHCLLPRLTRSVADATYCHYFTWKMHTLDVPGWPAGFFWDHALQAWYLDSQLFDRYANQQTMRLTANATGERLTHSSFSKLFKKWQNSLHKALKGCALSSEYLQKRNALLIMSKMLQSSVGDLPPMFPLFKHHNEELQQVMQNVYENDPREDVKRMAQALRGQLINNVDKCQQGEVKQQHLQHRGRDKEKDKGREGHQEKSDKSEGPKSDKKRERRDKKDRRGDEKDKDKGNKPKDREGGSR